MNHIIILKQLQDALIRIKNLIADVAANTLGAIQELEQNFAIKPKIRTVNLTVSGWNGTSAPYTQTVTVNGAIENENKQIVRLSVDPINSNINVAMDCGVYCTAQGNNTLTFTAFDDKPTEQVTFNIELQDL